MYGKILNAKVKSAEGISAASFSISNFIKDVFRDHDLLLEIAISNDSISLSIPMNSQSKGRISLRSSNHNPVAQPKSTILFGCSFANLFAKAVLSGIFAR